MHRVDRRAIAWPLSAAGRKGNPKKEEKRKPDKYESRQIQIHEWHAAQFGAITTMADKLQIQGAEQGWGERGI